MVFLHVNYKFLLLSIGLSLLVVSCSYEDTAIDLGTLFDPTWNFSSPASLAFDENYVEIKGGSAQLIPLDLKDSVNDFNNGFHAGVRLLDNNRLGLSNKLNSLLDVKEVLPAVSENLVGYWKFETNLLDSSGKGNHMTGFGDPSMDTSSQLGQNAISLDGVGDYLQTSDPGTLSFVQGTWGGWFFISSNGGAQKTLLEKPHTAHVSPFYMYDIRYNVATNAVVCSATVAGNLRTISFTLDNLFDRYHHIICKFDGSYLTLYLNGSLAMTSSLITGNMTTNGMPLRLGGHVNIGGENPTALLDEVYIWNTALTSGQIEKLYFMQSTIYTQLSSQWTPKWNTIEGYWKMDNNWLDSSGKERHGTVFGDSTFSVENKVGEGSGLFDGDADYINAPAESTSAHFPETITAWINSKGVSSSSAGSIVPFGIMPVTNTWHQLAIRAQNIQQDDVGCGAGDLDTGDFGTPFSTIALDQWYHVACVKTFSAGIVELTLFINGVEISSSTKASAAYGSLRSLYSIGRQKPASDRDWNGLVDEAAHWKSELTQPEIFQIYHRQKQKYAGHYDSKVFDQGGSIAWPHLSALTDIPFGKELVGDYNNDNTLDFESTSDYSLVNANLQSGLVGYWPLNETIDNSVGGADFEDKSAGNNHGNKLGTPTLGSPGKLNQSILLTGSADAISMGNVHNFDSSDSFSVSSWFLSTENGSGIQAIASKMVSNTPFQGWLVSKTSGSGGKDRFFVILRESDTGPISRIYVHSDSILEINKWYHVVFSYDGSSTAAGVKVYLNGEELTTTLTSDTLAGPMSNSANFNIGSRNDAPNSVTQFHGNIDELGLWNKVLTLNEAIQLYRRGANRVKFQVKSCVDATCECNGFNPSPLGNANDCDGDTITNSIDFDDTFQAKFSGPGGDGSTFYSELFNRNSTDLTFNCSLNSSDSDNNICKNDEISWASSSLPTSPKYSFDNFPLSARPSSNPYFQYRVYLEADDNSACALGTSCWPELTSVDLNSGGQNKYYGSGQEITPTTALSYVRILNIQLDADDCVTYQLSPDGSNYYHFNSGQWVLATLESHRSGKLELEENIVKFSEQFGPGELYIKTFLETNANQTSSCGIREIDVNYTTK